MVFRKITSKAFSSDHIALDTSTFHVYSRSASAGLVVFCV